MTEVSPLLSLVTSREGDVVNIHVDRAGLDVLLSHITWLIKRLDANKNDHVHLFTEAWGGWELTGSILEAERDAGCKQVNHLQINAWTPEWREKLEL